MQPRNLLHQLQLQKLPCQYRPWMSACGWKEFASYPVWRISSNYGFLLILGWEPQAPDADTTRQKVLRAKKAKWHRSMKSFLNDSSLPGNKMHQHIPHLFQSSNQLRFQVPRGDQGETERTSERLYPKMSAVKWHLIFWHGPHVAFQYGPGEGRNQEGWDALFNMFVECGENWLQCDLVTQNSDVREHARNGCWALMSKVVTWKQRNM